MARTFKKTQEDIVKKTQMLIMAALTFASLTASAAVTVRYYNHDSQKYEFQATCSGSKYPAIFDSSRTSSYTIQGSGPCTVHTGAGDVTLKDGDNIEIKDGKIIIK
jgi:hypothetical protein